MRSGEQHWLVRFDIRETYRWYERQERGLGRRFNKELRTILRRLPEQALLYAVRFDDIRRVNLPTFPYGVFYFVEESRVVVLAVLHAARDPRRNSSNAAKPMAERARQRGLPVGGRNLVRVSHVDALAE